VPGVAWPALKAQSRALRRHLGAPVKMTRRKTLEPEDASTVGKKKQVAGWSMRESRHGSKKGFASMDAEKRRQIARKGGRSVPNEKRSFSQNHKLASEAGRKGGRHLRRREEGAD